MATLDTLADRSTGSQIAGKAYFETSTNKFIVWNGESWIELHSDGTGAISFPTIIVYNNESDFISSTDYPDYTIIHVKDNDKLYVWDGGSWYKYNNDSTV